MRTELVNAKDQDGLVDLESQDLGLDQGKRLSVNLDQTLSGLDNHGEYIVRMRARSWQWWCTLQWATAMGDNVSICFVVCGGSGSRTSRGLLLAEALHALGSHVGRLWDVRAVRRWAWICGCLVVSRRRSCSVQRRRNCVRCTDHRLALATSTFSVIM
jgi:hypothetical protein